MQHSTTPPPAEQAVAAEAQRILRVLENHGAAPVADFEAALARACAQVLELLTKNEHSDTRDLAIKAGLDVLDATETFLAETGKQRPLPGALVLKVIEARSAALELAHHYEQAADEARKGLDLAKSMNDVVPAALQGLEERLARCLEAAEPAPSAPPGMKVICDGNICRIVPA